MLRKIRAACDVLVHRTLGQVTLKGDEARLSHIVAASLENCGHVAIGLGDYPYAELGTPTNGEVIHFIAQHARGLDREVATRDETRDMLGMA
jgi:uncharacterized protein (DUF849 family)